MEGEVHGGVQDLEEVAETDGTLDGAQESDQRLAPLTLAEKRTDVQARGLITSVQAASSQADDTDLVRGVLACGFYPLLGCLEAGPHMTSNPQKTRLVTAGGEEVLLSLH